MTEESNRFSKPHDNKITPEGVVPPKVHKSVRLILSIVKGQREEPKVEDHHITTWSGFIEKKTPNFLAQLAGCCLTWFLMDIAFFSQSL